MIVVSVVSVAVKTSAPAVVDFTVNVATPEASVIPETVVIVGVPGPDVLASVTLLPETGLLFTSFKVTVIVEVAEPSATTDVGNATTVDVPALTEPVVSVVVVVAAGAVVVVVAAGAVVVVVSAGAVVVVELSGAIVVVVSGGNVVSVGTVVVVVAAETVVVVVSAGAVSPKTVPGKVKNTIASMVTAMIAMTAMIKNFFV
jgi:hypothetical protein